MPPRPGTETATTDPLSSPQQHAHEEPFPSLPSLLTNQTSQPEPSSRPSHPHEETSHENQNGGQRRSFTVNRQSHANGHGGGPSAIGSTTVATGPGGDGTGVAAFGVGMDDWEQEYERQKNRGWDEKLEKDLEGWRGGHGKPRSAYPRQALPPMSYYHTPVTGVIGQHLPKEMVRIERDWTDGEVCQFETVFPIELDNRISPQALSSFINTLNAQLQEAYKPWPNALDNVIGIASLWTSLWWRQSHFEKVLQALEKYIENVNHDTFNPAGLNVLSPRDVALQFLEIEYY
ncbi:hypothetical protein L198_02933 [Cryptococcus wingfieldii CBS 7118]|uniref:Ras modification protein ERF4 n=1 Tax=Cryptococcus wingfieldii CBS 7118 TaxID=1295528 RepID=A0A1E3JIG7_9TREE|nr:hypothetical protein L198_02933 [Cryptococcus wingfieldii CBS 7118]ODO00613.1 hypothetical protein L198_02933 [Cryptococcus wingfieldii CBS 7118]